MERLFVLILAILLAFAQAPLKATETAEQLQSEAIELIADAPQPTNHLKRIASEFKQPEFSQQCCKVCRKGKACGDSCIAKDKTCHVGQGCACDG